MEELLYYGKNTEHLKYRRSLLIIFRQKEEGQEQKESSLPHLKPASLATETHWTLSFRRGFYSRPDYYSSTTVYS